MSDLGGEHLETTSPRKSEARLLHKGADAHPVSNRLIQSFVLPRLARMGRDHGWVGEGAEMLKGGKQSKSASISRSCLDFED